MKYEKEFDNLLGFIQYPINGLEDCKEEDRKVLMQELQDAVDNLQDEVTEWAIFLDDLVKNISDELERNMP